MQPVLPGIGTVCPFQPFQLFSDGMAEREIIGLPAGFFHMDNLSAADISMDFVRMLSDIGKPEDTAPGMAHKIKFFLAEPFKQQFGQRVEILQKVGYSDAFRAEFIVGFSCAPLLPHDNRIMFFQIPVIFLNQRKRGIPRASVQIEQ